MKQVRRKTLKFQQTLRDQAWAIMRILNLQERPIEKEPPIPPQLFSTGHYQVLTRKIGGRKRPPNLQIYTNSYLPELSFTLRKRFKQLKKGKENSNPISDTGKDPLLPQKRQRQNEFLPALNRRLEVYLWKREGQGNLPLPQRHHCRYTAKLGCPMGRGKEL